MIKVTDIIQSPLFARQKKKLKRKQIQSLDDAIKEIVADPGLGESKIGDLQGVRVHKFRMDNNQILLAYRYYLPTSRSLTPCISIPLESMRIFTSL